MPEVNHVLIAGNLTKDPQIRKTASGIPVINFCLASNHRYRDASNQWAEDVCYVGVVAWSKLADSCMAKLRKGSAVLVDGELQSRTWHAEDGSARTVVEIKAHRIQFLNKQEHADPTAADCSGEYISTDDIEYAEAQAEERATSEERMAYYAAGFDENSVREILSERAQDHHPMELKLRARSGESI